MRTGASSLVSACHHRVRRSTYLAKVDFIEDDLLGMTDAPEPCQECQGRDNDEADLEVPLGRRLGGLLVRLDKGIQVDVGHSRGGAVLFAGARDVSLAHAALPRRSGSGSGPHDGRLQNPYTCEVRTVVSRWKYFADEVGNCWTTARAVCATRGTKGIDQGRLRLTRRVRQFAALDGKKEKIRTRLNSWEHDGISATAEIYWRWNY
jgi:hypothetical protein